MNPEAEVELKRILAKDADQLTEEEKGFLRARKGYVGKISREAFASVFNEESVKVEKKVEKVKLTEYEKLLKQVQDLGYPVTPEATEEELRSLIEVDK